MKRKLTAFLLAFAMLLPVQTVSAGWEKCLRYEENGVIVRDRWKELDGSWYCFDEDGILRTGWVTSGGKWYHCGEDGKMDTGWLTLEDGVWYLTSSGAMAEGALIVGGKSYVFRADGRILPTDTEDLLDEKFLALSLARKLEILQELFPDGSYWNSLPDEKGDPIGVTSVPCVHGTGIKASDFDRSRCNIYTGKTGEYLGIHTCMQCLGFASLVSDFLFGPNSGVESFTDYASLQPGDHIRLSKEAHSVIVLEKTASYITVLECNPDYSDCRISWGRKISASKLKRKGTAVFLRRTGA